ncbi:MAG: hypothetical protein K2M87_05260, partial [Muribaculaceae bacterium]|nr:hypothetical protein [Muribaculaceae bacterium]
GYATLKRLYEVIDFSSWKTLTPKASVRNIVQLSNSIFKIQPGLWALEEARDQVLNKFKLKTPNKQSEEIFSHSFYQGLLVEIGCFRNFKTYIPPQDKHHLFLEKELGTMTNLKTLPQFTYDYLLRKARTIDVIWFNERTMPTHFYEVEHTTDIKNSLSKFFELQDFFASFFIVADKCRENEFNDKLNVSIFSPIKDRVKFLTYDKIANLHSNLTQQQKFFW